MPAISFFIYFLLFGESGRNLPLGTSSAMPPFPLASAPGTNGASPAAITLRAGEGEGQWWGVSIK